MFTEYTLRCPPAILQALNTQLLVNFEKNFHKKSWISYTEKIQRTDRNKENQF